MTDITGSKSIIWIGCNPAHYMRKMQCEIERNMPGKVFFLYTLDPSYLTMRSYETGGLPRNSKVLHKKNSVLDAIRLMRSKNPSMIIVSGYNDKFLLATLIWARVTGIKFCFMSDTNLLETLSESYLRRTLKKLFLSRLLSPAYKLLYIGSRNRDYYLWLIGHKRTLGKLFAFPYPAIPVGEEKQTGIVSSSEKLRIIFVGRFDPVKAIDKLIVAISLLSLSEKNSIQVDLYGDGSAFKQLVTLSDQLGLSEVIKFHGAVKSDKIADAYYGADIFILPSDREPWGVVVNEAMSAGIPVMCPFWVGSAADLVVDGVTGYLIDDNSPQTLAVGVQRVLGDHETLEAVGMRAKNMIYKGLWNQKAVTKRFEMLVSESSSL